MQQLLMQQLLMQQLLMLPLQCANAAAAIMICGAADLVVLL